MRQSRNPGALERALTIFFSAQFRQAGSLGDVTRIVHKCLDALIGAFIGHDDNDARRIVEDQNSEVLCPAIFLEQCCGFTSFLIHYRCP